MIKSVDNEVKGKVKASHTCYWALGSGWSPCTGSQATGDLSHPPGGRLPLLSARPAVTFPAAEHHHPLAVTQFKVPRSVEGW